MKPKHDAENVMLSHNALEKKTLPIIRQVRFKKVTFSFHVSDLESLGIGEELIDLIRCFKKKLEPNLERFQLPRLVRLIIWRENLLAQDASGTFGGVLPLLSTPFQISINTDNLHEDEQAFMQPSTFKGRLLHVFLHELAHFITTDEKEADKIAFETLGSIVLQRFDIEKSFNYASSSLPICY